MSNPLLQLSAVQLQSIALPKQAKNLAGQDFGRLRAISPAPRPSSSSQGTLFWNCICSCGTLKVVDGRSLRNNSTFSCGCLNSELRTKRQTTHGLTNTPTYRSWRMAKDRVSNPNNPRAKHYSQRGITMCSRWFDSFEAFLADMGERPKGTSLDRIDNDGNYEPGNCRWATIDQQAANQRHRQPAKVA